MAYSLDQLAQLEQEASILVDVLLDAIESGLYDEETEMIIAEALELVCELGDATRKDFKHSVSMN